MAFGRLLRIEMDSRQTLQYPYYKPFTSKGECRYRHFLLEIMEFKTQGVPYDFTYQNVTETLFSLEESILLTLDCCDGVIAMLRTLFSHPI
ncbi:hypothetical protein FKM82_016219 [Ascaphus truei]